MALQAIHKEISFGVGDTVRVLTRIKEGNKERTQAFEGMVIGIRGREENRSFVVRRIGANQIGIERIFPLSAPTIEKIDVVRHGTEGVKHAKLYYTRSKPRREVEKIYTRRVKKASAQAQQSAKKSSKKKAPKRK